MDEHLKLVGSHNCHSSWSYNQYIQSWSSLVRGQFKSKLWSTMFLNLVRSIWFERNELRFNKKQLYLSRIIDSIKLQLGQWIKYYAHDFPYSPLMVMNNLSAVWGWRPYKKKKQRLMISWVKIIPLIWYLSFSNLTSFCNYPSILEGHWHNTTDALTPSLTCMMKCSWLADCLQPNTHPPFHRQQQSSLL